jgi:hypothetical protein
MRRFQTWLTVGLLAVAPAMCVAGPAAPKKTAATAASAARARPNPQNEETARRVRQAIESSDVSLYEIEIKVQDGTAVLNGTVSTPNDKRQAELLTRKVKGVAHVVNKLAVADARAAAPAPELAAQAARGPVRPVDYEVEGNQPAQSPAALQPVPSGPGMPTGASHVIYNQPSLPAHAWPSYAAYPNYAAVSYPSAYSASAWPYIGPFYPYPQVPLGWRRATLEWDDGYWQLSFSPRTERWWWFLNPRNW